ncbi:OmpA family protein [Vibrio sp. S9_S30]|uniref:OmpA family protein n=1 Tax=Vibrio sp. S9_S30 TaxID=2720226 RepID=UPI0016800E07|nr:OmpA family protein [Vibrio sp. S9_S30]MBD1557216.1 OmpA family protein [Vibrio sp. S9_S30]
MINRDNSKLEELRSLVLGEQYESALNNFIEKSDETSRVADVIVEAIKQRNQKDNKVTEELSPIINSAIEVSINNNTQRFADILYPVIGAAVRKSVSTTFNQLLDSLNQVLTQNFSLKSIKWRYQAWRQGISYAQFLLMKTSVFEVEQVLLIHRETGLLLNSVANEGTETSDPELVSSMLTAITDFVSDSFRGNSNDTLEGVRLGDLLLKIEVAPHVILAAAVRGIPNQAVDTIISTTVEKVEQDYSNKLVNFSGDNEEFASSVPLLESCLLKNTLEDNAKERFPWRLFAILLAFIAIGLYQLFVYISISNEHQITRQLFEYEPNYFVAESTIQDENIVLSVLRKPGSRAPNDILKGINYLYTTQTIDDKVVDFSESGELPQYHPTIIDVVRHNLLSSLDEEESARIWLSDQTINIAGALKPNTLEQLKRYVTKVDSSLSLSIQDVTLLPPELTTSEQLEREFLRQQLTGFLSDNEALSVTFEQEKASLSGQVYPESLENIRRLLKNKALGLNVDMTALTTLTKAPDHQKQYNQLAQSLNQVRFQYELNVVTPKNNKAEIALFVSQAKTLMQLGKTLSPPLTPIFIVTGYSDDIGSKERNIQLSKQRASNVKQVMVENGMDENHIITLNISNIESTESISSALRRVTIDVINKDL